MEEEHRSKASSSPWLTILALLTTVHTSVFVAVTVYQFRNLGDITHDDQQINQRILKLQTKSQLTIPIKDSPSQDPENQGRQKRQTFLTDIFKIQEQILEQHCIDKNKTCPSGEQGERGDKGSQGLSGEKGSAGEKGEAGENGIKGMPGPKGLPGRAGVKGQQGERGIKGDKGLPGEQGPSGVNGVKGDKGDPGQQGSKGERGIKGSPGVPSAIGSRGKKGDPGQAGIQGTKGQKGELGPRGPSGQDRQNNTPDGCDCLRKSKSTRMSMYTYQGPFHNDS